MVNMEIVSVRRGRASRYLSAEECADLEARHNKTRHPSLPPVKLDVGKATTADTTRGKVITSANLWDGESFDGPFCTNTCAQNFGLAALAAGYRRERPS